MHKPIWQMRRCPVYSQVESERRYLKDSAEAHFLVLSGLSHVEGARDVSSSTVILTPCIWADLE